MASLVAINYGEALFELAQEENCLKLMKEQLQSINEAVISCRELREVMGHPKIEKEEKKKLIQTLFEGDRLLENFLQLLVDRNRFDAFSEIVQVFVKKANEALGIEAVTVISASKLSEEEKEQLKQVLMKKTGKKIELNCSVDPSCLAGVRVQIGNELLDNTIAGKLEKIKERVAVAALAS